MNNSKKILKFLKNIKPPKVHDNIFVMNPYENETVWKLVKKFYSSYYSDNNKRIIITLGKSERKAHRKTAQNFSKSLKTEIRYFRGEHKSFVFPRDDVKELIRLECS